ncbi:hypothetical protein AAY473_007358 [Plecturocebus cupreus]
MKCQGRRHKRQWGIRKRRGFRLGHGGSACSRHFRKQRALRRRGSRDVTRALLGLRRWRLRLLGLCGLRKGAPIPFFFRS